MIPIQKSHTALLVFSLSATQEARRKPILGTQKGNNRDLFKLLIEKTAQIIPKTGVDIIWMDEKKQVGNDFASRFTNAFQSLFAQGYDQVVSIGNDSPGLTTQHIETAINNLRHNDMVLGPATDGGVYLLGVQKKAFDPKSFQNLPWQRKNLLKTIVSSAKKNDFKCFCLDFLDDIDSTADLFAFAEKEPGSKIGLFLAKIGLRELKPGHYYPIPPTCKKRFSPASLRGPPVFHMAV